MKMLPSGNAVCEIGLAVNRQFRDQNGENREETTFVDVVAFGRQAEVIGKYLSKGRPLLMEGRLKLDQWEDKQSGQKRSKLRVVLENFQFVGGRDDAQSGGAGGYEQTSPPRRGNAGGNTPPAQDFGGGADSYDDGEVPF